MTKFVGGERCSISQEAGLKQAAALQKLVNMLILYCKCAVIGLSPWRLGFSPKRIHVKFLVDEMALRWVLLGVLPFSAVSIVPPVFHVHSTVTVAMTLGIDSVVQ